MLMFYLQAIEDDADKTKFEKIYNRYHDLMIYAAMQILHNQQDAEDAVHQAFLALIDNLNKVRDISSKETKTYLIVIAEHKAIDILRTRKRFIDMNIDEAIGGIQVEPPGDNALASAIARLPARYREVLLLHYGNGYTASELAAILGIKSGSVQRLIYRAKEALQKILEEEGLAI